MVDDLRDFDGSPLECEELLQAQLSVRQWMVSASRWGRPEPAIDPAPPMSEQPSIEKEYKVTVPRPSSNERRHASNPVLRKCAEDTCATLISGAPHRCPEHRTAHRLLKQRAAQKIVYERNMAAKRAQALSQ